MELSSDLLSGWDLCERRMVWTSDYQVLRVSPLRALYAAIESGLTGDDPERAAFNALMSQAASPGLDIEGADVYDIAIHLANLAAILSVYLRAGEGPWVHVPVHPFGQHSWRSDCWELPDGRIRRVVLVDHWSDERRDAEVRSWRTVGELAALNRPMLLNAIEIGHTVSRRRVSSWTRAYVHPRNGHIRFKRKTYTAQEFTATWRKKWRETTDLKTSEWLNAMQKDEVFGDLVHSVAIPVPARSDEFRQEMKRMAGAIEDARGTPPMRRAGCYGFSPCPFIRVCHGAKVARPEECGFRRV